MVSYCTGGIRCEKAAILMREQGLEHVYQLEGGILKYFEETDGAHYRGGCFVFDERRVLDPALDTVPTSELPPSAG
ncbi:rhodanese superfamily protein [compost metagenome]